MKKQVCIIGVGFVGESLVNVFSKKYNVIGYDISHSRVSTLQQLYKNNENVVIQSSLDNVEYSDLFCIAVPTLLNHDRTINDTHIKTALNIIESKAREKSCVVIESSVHVGMTRKLTQNIRKKNIFIGFSPERIDPGRVFPTADDIPKIISGYDTESLLIIKDFYGSVFNSIVCVSSMETAEMCKLTENCFRMINIAYANEIDDACKKLYIDSREVTNACATKPFGYMPFYSGLGVGGHCIPINPDWLAVTSETDLPLLMEATKITLNRPKNEARKLIQNYPNIKSVLVVGIAFKFGESLTTNSAGLSYAHELINNGISVTLYDPMVDMTQFTKIFNILNENEFTTEYIDNNFNFVCVAIKQRNIDLSVLYKCIKSHVIFYCESK